MDDGAGPRHSAPSPSFFAHDSQCIQVAKVGHDVRSSESKTERLSYHRVEDTDPSAVDHGGARVYRGSCWLKKFNLSKCANKGEEVRVICRGKLRSRVPLIIQVVFTSQSGVCDFCIMDLGVEV